MSQPAVVSDKTLNLVELERVVKRARELGFDDEATVHGFPYTERLRAVMVLAPGLSDGMPKSKEEK